MQHPDTELRELARRERLGLRLGRLRLEHHRLAHQRADHVDLAALADLLADEVIGARALVLADDPGLDRLAAARQLADRRRVQVAVGGQRERPRDRGRRHVEGVRRQTARPLGVERGPLADPEAVLLVDDGDRQLGELDIRLDQRVGADGQAGLPGGESLEVSLALRRRRRPGEQREGNGAVGAQEHSERARVLLGQGLGRCHQRGLAAALGGPEHRVQADAGLARAHLAHQKPLHRGLASEVGVHVGDRLTLIAGELEGQRLDPLGHQGSRRVERPRDPPLAPPRPPVRQRGLVEQKLFEGEAAACSQRLRLPRGEVRGRQRVGGARHPERSADRRRDRLDRISGHRNRLPCPLADPLGPQPLGGRVDRDHARRVDAGGSVTRVEQLVLADGEAVARQLPAQEQPGSGLELVCEPAAVEPRSRRRARVVPDVGLEDPQAPAARRPLLRGRQHLDLDGGLLPDPEVADPHRSRRVAVGVGDVAQQVAEALDPELGAGLGQLRPDPLQVGQVGVEDLRDGPVDASVEKLLAGQLRTAPDRTRSGWPGLGHGVIQGRFHARKARRRTRCINLTSHEPTERERLGLPPPAADRARAAARADRARRRDHRGLDPRRPGARDSQPAHGLHPARGRQGGASSPTLRATTPTASGRAAPATCTRRPATPAPSTPRGSTPTRGPTTPSSKSTSPSTWAASTPPTSTTSRCARRAAPSTEAGSPTRSRGRTRENREREGW